jgi:hypothetical protein
VKRYGKYGRKVSWIVERLWNDMENMEKTEENCEMIWKYRRKESRIVKWFGKFGRKASRIVIRYGQYKRNVSQIVKR